MSKAARKRASYNERIAAKREREEFAAKQAKVRRITAIVTVSLIAALLLIFIIGAAIYNRKLDSGDYLRNEVAASSKNIEVDGAMMNYYYNDVFNSFLDYYGSYVEYYGFNTSLGAKSQYISDDQTWFEYFMSGAKSNVTGYLAMNEGAISEGVSLTDEEKSALTERVKLIDTGLYGRGVNSDDILNAKSIEALAYKYQAIKTDEFEPTAAEIEESYNENPKSYQSVDYIAYEFDWSDGYMTETTADLASERIADAKDIETFEKLIAELLRRDSEDMSDEAVETYIESFTTEGALYTSNNELSEWAFSANVGDTKVVKDEDNSITTVYMLKRAAERDETPTVNVRHILFTSDTYGSTEGAYKAAQVVLSQFESGDKTSESFALLALAYTEDESTCYNGGLYEGLADGVTISDFNDWCFDSSRASGDYEIIESSNGIHIMYYESAGQPNWYESVKENIISDRFEELSSELLANYPVAFDESLINAIPD